MSFGRAKSASAWSGPQFGAAVILNMPTNKIGDETNMKWSLKQAADQSAQNLQFETLCVDLKQILPAEVVRAQIIRQWATWNFLRAYNSGSKSSRLEFTNGQRRWRIVFSRHMHQKGATLHPDRGPNKARSRIMAKERVINPGWSIKRFETDNSTLGKTISRKRSKLAPICANINYTIECQAFES
jgi:hypothetical protein